MNPLKSDCRGDVADYQPLLDKRNSAASREGRGERRPFMKRKHTAVLRRSPTVSGCSDRRPRMSLFELGLERASAATRLDSIRVVEGKSLLFKTLKEVDLSPF